ncbi:hypothetical protein MMC25_001887 [Agyrium rufum]|nr:hypothetical protein [Agyrium rufum]
MVRSHWVTWVSVASLLQYGISPVTAAPTWPSSVDELEDIIYLVSGYRGRDFAGNVIPCDGLSLGAGRLAAAEWLRTAFHDMATANVYQGTGGIDASLLYELGGDNIGDAFATTLQSYSPFVSSRSSLSDLIATGVYAAVRSCSGPVVPIRGGRVDATSGGPPGVPLPQNSLYTFQNQFDRMGFNNTEMIAVTACGHTIGGVHSVNFPQIVPAGTAPNDYALFDTTTVFDSNIASEWVAGHPQDPLDGAPAKAVGKASDLVVFGQAADKNATMKALAVPATFANRCTTLLQRMIEVVPSGVKLSDPIAPYEVKPNNLALTLLAGGNQLTFSGEIRIRTTVTPSQQISSFVLLYKDRTGGTNCGSCSITAKPKGTARGFDDTFTFYTFSSTIPASTSILSFTVVVTYSSGTTTTFSNNGAGFPVQDSIFLQGPQSCLSTQSDANGQNAMTITAAVRNSVAASSINLAVTTRVDNNGLPVLALSTQTSAMTQSTVAGAYTLYTISTTIGASQTKNSKFDVTIGSGTGAVGDTFKNTGDLSIGCNAFDSGSSSSSSSSTIPSSTSTSTSAPVSSTTSTSTAVTSTTSTSTTVSSTSLTSTAISSTSSTSAAPSSTTSSTASSTTLSTATSSSAASSTTLSTMTTTSTSSTTTAAASTTTNPVTSTAPPAAPKPTLANYNYQGCFTDTVSQRILSGQSSASQSMTYKSCASFCKGYTYFGVEYSTECYCGNTFTSPMSSNPETDCSNKCAGDATEVCGGANRINVFSSNSSGVASPSNATIPGYAYYGCFVDAVGTRVLNNNSMIDPNLTIEECAGFCAGYAYFGAEYANECYCGSVFANPTSKAAEGDCSFVCAGNSTEICGAGNRLSMYQQLTS